MFGLRKLFWYFNRECKYIYDKSLNWEKKFLRFKW